MKDSAYIIKYFKIVEIVLLSYILFSCSHWFFVRSQSEKQLKTLCENIKKDISKNELIILVSSYQDFVIYHASKNEILFYTKKALPETPTCHIEFKNDKVSNVKLFDSR